MRVSLLNILKASGLIISTSRGRRLIAQDAIKVNGKLVNTLDDLNMTMFPGDKVTVGSKEIDVDNYFNELEGNDK